MENLFAEEAHYTCRKIAQMLCDKNAKYGNAAMDPVRIFSKVSPLEGIRVRIDDKLSRYTRRDVDTEEDEDVIDDLIGYLVLLKMELKKDTRKEE